MAGHFPFLGKGMRYGMARLPVTAFFEHHGLNLELQEKYYKWWYDWTKNFVMKDFDLQATKSVGFAHYPYGQHSLHSFHLNDKMWASIMIDLGDLIRDTILPKLSADELHKLEHEHHEMVHHLEEEAKGNPRKPSPDIGYFRHM